MVAAAEIVVVDRGIFDDGWGVSAADYCCDTAVSSSADDGYCCFDYDIHSIEFDFASDYHYYFPI